MFISRFRSTAVVLVCRLALAAMLAIGLAWQADAKKSPEGFLPVIGEIAADGSSVKLSWPEAKPPRAGKTVVYRRQLGETGVDTWKPVSQDKPALYAFEDRGTGPGVAYEYRVERVNLRDGSIIDAGYWTTGVDVPAKVVRGTALLVIEETVEEPLAARIDRFEMDLVGDGWQVRRLSVARGDSGDPVANLAVARDLRDRIREAYWQDPFGGHALVLIGHVPMVMSGRAAPDGHAAEPHATDLFYADIEGPWPDDGKGTLRPDYVYGGRIAMPVGRIDFRSVSGDSTALEHDLLLSYFDKNHAWRQGFLGDLREAYGTKKYLSGEIAALTNIVGPDALTEGGHHDAGERQPWLLGVNFGDWNGRDYRAQYSAKPVFAINFGSYKQKIDQKHNAMNALLALPWYPLAVGWGSRPTWWLHSMAMGESMGYAHMRTVNNGEPWDGYPKGVEYLPTGDYIWRNPVWVNLLGDPTLRPFPLAPASDFRAEAVDGGVRLSWNSSPADGVTGYRIFRSENRIGPYSELASTGADDTTFTDTAALADGWYMLRAEGLQTVHAGSFRTLSQGRFAQVGRSPVLAPDLTFNTAPGDPVSVFPSSAIPDGTLVAPVSGPDHGSLTRDGDVWTLEPLAGYAGDIRFRYFVSNGESSDTGTVIVTVGDR